MKRRFVTNLRIEHSKLKTTMSNKPRLPQLSKYKGDAVPDEEGIEYNEATNTFELANITRDRLVNTDICAWATTPAGTAHQSLKLLEQVIADGNVIQADGTYKPEYVRAVMGMSVQQAQQKMIEKATVASLKSRGNAAYNQINSDLQGARAETLARYRNVYGLGEQDAQGKLMEVEALSKKRAYDKVETDLTAVGNLHFMIAADTFPNFGKEDEDGYLIPVREFTTPSTKRLRRNVVEPGSD